MITITTHKNNHKFEYQGKIELVLEEFMIAVFAEFDFVAGKIRSTTVDKFWIEDIKEIRGTM